MASQYARGRRAEWKTRDWILKHCPEALVIRSAGSKGPVDLVAIRPGKLALVQVKTGPRRPKPVAILPCGGVVSVAWWPPRAKEPIIIEPLAA